ncbi:MAG: hypothetical protein Q9215_003082 [Flavoplaca cf. flavocitrina]
MLSLDQLPPEIIVNILNVIPDFVSLRKFTLAFPPASELLKLGHRRIFLSVINRIEPFEYRNLVVATLAANYNPRAACCDYPLDGCKHFCGKTRPLDFRFTISCIADPIQAVRDMALMFQDTVNFLNTFTEACFRECGLRPAKQKPLSTKETHRIIRALWRFHFLCAVAYPKSTLQSKKRRPQLGDCYALMNSLTSELGWEYVELECVYFHLCDRYAELADLPKWTRRKKIPLHAQPPFVQRLATAVGFSLDNRTPDKIGSGRHGEPLRWNFVQNTFTDYPIQYKNGKKKLTSWDDGFVRRSNKGWRMLMKQQVNQVDRAVWPVDPRRCTETSLQRRGFYIWDEVRFQDWTFMFCGC